MTPVVKPSKADLDFAHKLGKTGQLFTPIGDLAFAKLPAVPVKCFKPLTAPKAHAALTQLRKLNPRLPKLECERLLKRWNKSI
jgi:hypothetical protein